jgi:tetrapyrrole methylase family protein/MazG family protein
MDIPPEEALALACEKFRRRYGYVTERLATGGGPPASLERMESLWQEAKLREKGQG